MMVLFSDLFKSWEGFHLFFYPPLSATMNTEAIDTKGVPINFTIREIFNYPHRN